MLVLILFCNLIDAAVPFHQTDYEVIHHRMEIVYYNKSYARNPKASLVPFNRTIRAFNASLEVLVDLTKESMPISAEVYKLSMNDYRPFPFSLNLEYCKLRRENMFGINDIEKHSNAPHCPVKKGRYYVNMYRPDESQFPPHLFPGDFKITVKAKYGPDSLFEVHWYGAIKRIEKLQWN